MPRILRISQRDAVRVLGKTGFVIVRQSRHIIMRKGTVTIQIPRHTEIKATTMGGIAKDAGLTPDQFRALL
jgi:predicted RNA binding protein YcfA (HicA-like mRNA interferase family)